MHPKLIELQRSNANPALPRRAFLWFRKGAATALDQATYSVTGFAVSILLARWLNPEEFGVYALVFSVLIFIGMFQNSLILEPLSVFGVRKHPDRLREYVALLGKWQAVTTVGFCVLIMVGILAAPVVLPHPWPPNLAGVAIATPAILMAWLVRRVFYVAGDPAGAFVNSLAYAGCTLLSLLVVSRLVTISGLTAFLALAVGASASALLGWIRFSSPNSTPAGSPLPVAQVFRDHWRYGKWLVVTNIPYWLVLYGYTFWTGALLSLTEVGGLRAMQSLVTPVAVMLAALGTLILPWTVRKFDQQGTRWLSSAIVAWGVFFVGLAMVGQLPLLIFGSQLDDLLFRGQYSSYVWILPYLIAAQIVGTAALAPGIGLRCLERTQQIFVAYLTGAGSILLLGYPLGQMWGLRGLLVGMIVSQFVLAVAMASTWWLAFRDIPSSPSREPSTATLAEAVPER